MIELPRAALRDGDRVLVVDEGNRLRFRIVTVLRIQRDTVLVVAGLAPGERVCVSPLQRSAEPVRRLITRWVDNPVAANLLMLIFLAGGLASVTQLRKEEFPNLEMDYIRIAVPCLGALALFPAFGLTISSLSLMGFLLVLGIVVDDATVVGERVYACEMEGLDPREAAIRGTSEVPVPVIFGVFTTQAAFLPIIALQGDMASFFAAVGLTVVLCLCFSLLESQLVLPAHLACQQVRRQHAADQARFERLQGRVSEQPERFIARRYQPTMRRAAHQRYVVCAIALAVMITMVGLVASGRIVFPYFPAVEGDPLFAALAMPEGTPVELTAPAARRLEASAAALRCAPGSARGAAVRIQRCGT